MSELKNQELPVVSLKDVALVLFIDERMKVAAEWGYSERKPLSKLVLDGIDAEANERIRFRLSAALNELKAKDTELEYWRKKARDEEKNGLRMRDEGNANIRRLQTELAAKDARIAELTGCKFSDRSHAALKDRAEAAESRLRAVLEFAEKRWDMPTFVARLRSIVEGK